MTDPDHEHVTCPACGKSYRWKQLLIGRLVPCRKCGTEFTIPRKPGKGLPLDPAEDSQASVYALAMDIEEEPEPVTTSAKAAPTTSMPADHVTPPPAVSATGNKTPGPGESESEEPAQVSEAVKAKRREEQRKAAAQAQRARSWRDYKALIIVGVVAVVFALALWILLSVSDGLDGILGMAR